MDKLNNKEIIEGNKIIDKFFKQTGQHVTIVIMPDKMEYHTSWDWLMPVVEKIGTMATFHTQSHEDGEIYVSVLVGEKYYQSGKGKPLAQYYIAVVSFIKYYNSQK